MPGRNKNKNSIGPILFLYYEESLVSLNLNSKQLRFHGTHPKLYVPSLQSLINVCIMPCEFEKECYEDLDLGLAFL